MPDSWGILPEGVVLAKPENMAKSKRRYSENKYRDIINNNQSLIEKRKLSDLSDGEKKVANCLKIYGVNYEREYYMKGLYSPTTGLPLFFDFYIPKYKIAIEFDGVHHFKPIYGEKQFQNQVKKDCFKNYFCKKNNIILLRIPFWQHKNTKEIIFKALEKYFAFL